MNMRSPCFPLSTLELTIQLFVEYIECHAILMTSACADVLIHFSSAPSFYLVPYTPACLLCDQYVVSWNEATGFNMILRDQIAPFDPRRDSSDLLYPTGSSVHMHIMSRNRKEKYARGKTTLSLFKEVFVNQSFYKNLQFSNCCWLFCFSWHCCL